MSTTNMQQWNPFSNNQENDAAYTADSQRAGGATDPSLFASPLANKLFYQLTTYVTALFQSLANRGYSTTDVDLSVLTSQCNHFLVTTDLKGGLDYVLYAPTLVFNAGAFGGFQVTLTGDLAFTITGATVGDTIALAFTQDGTGGHAVIYPGNVVGGAAPSVAANANTVQLFKVLNDNILHAAGPAVVS